MNGNAGLTEFTCNSSSTTMHCDCVFITADDPGNFSSIQNQPKHNNNNRNLVYVREADRRLFLDSVICWKSTGLTGDNTHLLPAHTRGQATGGRACQLHSSSPHSSTRRRPGGAGDQYGPAVSRAPEAKSQRSPRWEINPVYTPSKAVTRGG